MRNNTVCIIVILLLGLAACQQAAEIPAFTEQDRAQIVATTNAVVEIANGSKNWDRYAELYYAPEGAALPANAPIVQGRQAIAEWLKSFPPIIEMKIEHQTIEGDGNLAYVYGTYHMKTGSPDSDEIMEDRGKYIEVWKRQADGGWLIIYDIFNSDLPAQ